MRESQMMDQRLNVKLRKIYIDEVFRLIENVEDYNQNGNKGI